MLLSVLFLAILIVACLWIVQPFILGFAWAGTIVIATWPILLRLQKIALGTPFTCRTGDDAVAGAVVHHPHRAAG
ncbi:Putative membrane protein [Citrobacter freundii]|uniref:Membrane protein n=1 Tax=Citrobacter freundii TaxID=546 RepID=A0A7G2ITN1_CITFR|nr:Putative membrane protein [Citrobacter freundii]